MFNLALYALNIGHTEKKKNIYIYI